MGDRAVIVYKSQPEVGLYLHWDGRPERVKEIIDKAKEYARTPGADSTYSFARLVEAAVSDNPKQETSFGVGLTTSLDTDNGDNGVYIIGDNWEIDHRPDGKI